MKGLFLVLVLSSNFLFSQNNIAVFHADKNAVSVAATAGQAVSVAPFELVNGMVVVKATINGLLGNFVLDTGSPGIVINSTEHDRESGYEATGCWRWAGNWGKRLSMNLNGALSIKKGLSALPLI